MLGALSFGLPGQLDRWGYLAALVGRATRVSPLGYLTKLGKVGWLNASMVRCLVGLGGVVG